MIAVLGQVEDCQLRDYEGNYEEFLEKNEDEAEKMAVKEERVKEIEKACSSASCWVFHLPQYRTSA